MALTDDIFYLSAVEGSKAFEDLYFFKFGRHADVIKEEIWKKTLAGTKEDNVLLDELMRGIVSNCHGNTTEEESMKIMMRWLSKQVVQKTFEAGTTSHATEFDILMPGISALIGQTVAEVVIDKGVIYHPGNVTMKGPEDRDRKDNWNWAYINTGHVKGKICIGTYGDHDGIYWKTYWNEYRESHCKPFEMSAGNKQNRSFQVCVWDSSGQVLCHLYKVFYRDFIHVGRAPNGHYCVAHGKGELWGTGGGTVSIIDCIKEVDNIAVGSRGAGGAAAPPVILRRKQH